MYHGDYTGPAPTSPDSSMPYTVSDLSYQMSQYSLQRQHEHTSSHETEIQDYPTFTCGYPERATSPFSDPSTPSSTSSSSLISTPPSSASSSSRLSSGYHSTNVRQQRQRALRRQCSASHLREISALVSRMVDSGEQCLVSATVPNITFGGRSRHNSDMSTASSSSATSDYAVDEDDVEPSVEDYSEPESFADPFEGYKIQESAGFVEWNCPWTTSRARSPESRKACVKKDTSARKCGRKRA